MQAGKSDRRHFLRGSALALVGCAAAGSADSSAEAQGPQFPGLLEGLKGTKGCLGVETARTSSGKNCIFAWFEDKAAVLRWYYSPVHMTAMKTYFPDHKAGKPLADILEKSGPIMAIAALTPTDKPMVDGTTLPIKQISIELYAPMAGGLSFGGRFAPEALKVPKAGKEKQG